MTRIGKAASKMHHYTLHPPFSPYKKLKQFIPLKYGIDSHFLFVVLTDVYCQVNLLQVTVFQASGGT